MKNILIIVILFFSINNLIGQNNTSSKLDSLHIEVPEDEIFNKLLKNLGHYYIDKYIQQFSIPKKIKDGIIVANYPQSKGLFFTTPIKSNQLNGLMKMFYSTGELMAEIDFFGNEIHGGLFIFWKNGNLKERVDFVNGKKQGHKTSFYKNENISERMHYAEGHYIGFRESWHLNGVKHMEVNEDYEYGGMNGAFNSWNDKGVKLTEGSFKGIYPIGEVRHYYKNGQLKKKGIGQTFLQDTLPTNQYNIRKYLQGDVTGEYIYECSIYEEWYPNGQIKVKLLPDTDELILV